MFKTYDKPKMLREHAAARAKNPAHEHKSERLTHEEPKRLAHARDFAVYFIQADNGLIKIGSTYKDIYARLRWIGSFSPCSVRLIAAIHGNRVLEDGLHYRFAHLHSHSEWFRPGEDLLAYIATLPPLPPEPDEDDCYCGDVCEERDRAWRERAKRLSEPTAEEAAE